LNKVARYINNRPMKLLRFKTPYQVFVALASWIQENRRKCFWNDIFISRRSITIGN